MKNEIGGYIELDEFKGEEYYPQLLALNSARNAVVYLIKARGIRKICLPYFLCDCISRVCRENGCEIVPYHIGFDFKPDERFNPPSDSWFYLVNYYGQLSDQDSKEYSKKYSHLILDNVQAFFQKPIEGIDTVYTCRKYFGVPDGAYLATDATLEVELDTDKSKARMTHILGRYEGRAGDYYNLYQTAEEAHYSIPLRKMSRLTHNVLRAIDYNAVRWKRNKNWTMLSDAFSSGNKLKLKAPEAPFMYPLYCENGIELRKRLAEQHIFIPMLWPDVLTLDSSSEERDMAQNILPLPVDQRYGEDEMAAIIRSIKEGGK